ncbi:hypothetical protein N2152v2_009889 [Parachlorella kessleri]
MQTVRQHVATKSRSAREVTQQYLKHIAATEGQIASFITVDEERALQQAASIDERIAGGEAVGPLAGVPIAVKDNICTRGLQTTAGSRSLQGYLPPFDATAVGRLRAAGAVLIGKTNMDEFGMGSSTENSAYQVTCNPWDTSRVPGGSSGGSAAAVAANQCAAALGSDTGGSIRQPAHFCGVVGLKPTYGRVSRYGLVAYASSLDCIGPLAPSVADAAELLSVMAGPDANDSTCSSRPSEDFAAGLVPREQLASRPLEGKRFGVIRETSGEGVDAGVTAAVDAAVRHLESLGASVEEVSLPSFAYGLPAYYVIALSEASSNLSRYDGVRYGPRAAAAELRSMYNQTRHDGLGQEVKRRILMGTYALSAGYYDAYYKRAQQVRTLIQREMGAALGQYDALLCPAAPTPAYKLGSKVSDPLAMYKGKSAGCSSREEEGGARLPVGLQFVGRAFGEGQLLQLAHVFEQTAEFARGMPQVYAA